MSQQNTSVPVPALTKQDKQTEEALSNKYGAQEGVWTKSMLSTLERGVKGNKWFSLIDKVYAVTTLDLAWEKVRANAGACGVDRMSVEHFDKDSPRRLLVIKQQLKEANYQPMPVKRVMIPKPGTSEKRPLGIPAVTDRIVQAALKMVIEPIFEKDFAPNSFGFRPRRSCKDALRKVENLLDAGHLHVVDIDIKGYFDAIPHDHLMKCVETRISDGKVLDLIENFLKQGIMGEDGTVRENGQGTPQGGLISPLLANIYLNPLDWQLANQGIEMIRYADDIIVTCKSAEAAEATLEQIREWMTAHGLTLHPEKTRIVNMEQPESHFDFLGYRFFNNKKGKRLRLVRPKSKKKFRDAIRPLTKRCNGHSMETIIARITPIMKGWYNYFKQAKIYDHQELDSWVRMRLRSILRKRNKRKGRGRGRDHLRYKNSYFTALGFPSLVEAKTAETLNLLKQKAQA